MAYSLISRDCQNCESLDFILVYMKKKLIIILMSYQNNMNKISHKFQLATTDHNNFNVIPK